MFMSEERIRFLISEFKKGNQGVFDEFFNLTKNQVFYNIFSIVKNAENSEDILQETYVKFLLNLDQIDENSSILGYLMVISRNLSLDFLKKHKKLVVPVDGEVVVPSKDENLIDSNMIIECAKKSAKLRKAEEKVKTDLSDKKFTFEGNGKLSDQQIAEIFLEMMRSCPDSIDKTVRSQLLLFYVVRMGDKHEFYTFTCPYRI